MAPALFTYTLPTLQLVCHLVATGNSSIGTTTPSTIAPQSSTTARALPPGYIAYPDFGVAYKVHNELESWHVARDRCVQEGAHLATPDSIAKIALLRKQPWPKADNQCAYSGFYLKDGDDSTWYSVSTGSPVSNLSWVSGEPSGSGRCVRIFITSSATGLGKFNCENPRPSVCQISYP